MPANAPASRLAELRVLCTQVNRLRSLLAIDAELCTRYPELAPMLAAVGGAADVIRADIEIRRVPAGPEIFARTTDYAVIPDRIHQHWRTSADHQLTAAYVRYQCAGIADTYADAAAVTELHAAHPRRFVVEWGDPPEPDRDKARHPRRTPRPRCAGG